MLKILKKCRLPVLCAVITAVFLCMFSITAFADDESEEEEPGESFYTVTNTLGSYFSYSQSTKGDGFNGFNSSTIAGNAGGVMGYVKQGWLVGMWSVASCSYDYDAMSDIAIKGGGTTNAVLDYCQYGYLLGELGLDDTGTSSFNLARLFGGSIVLVMYVCCQGLSTVFLFVMIFLKIMNPFNWVATAVNNTGLLHSSIKMDDPINDAATRGTGIWGLVGGDTLSGLSGVVGKWYTVFYDFSWALIIPVCLAILICMIGFMRDMNKFKSKLKNYIIRIVFIMIGVPICGSFYSLMLDRMVEASVDMNTAATRIVASTFVDFKSWAVSGRLAVPNGAVLSVKYDPLADSSDGGALSPTSESILNTRATAYHVNRKFAFSYLPAQAPFATTTSLNNSGQAVVDWNTTVNNTPDYSYTWSRSNQVKSTMYLIMTYISGDQYAAGSYETLVRGQLGNYDKASVGAMFEESDSQKKLDDESSAYASTRFNAIDAFGAGIPNVYANGGLCLDGSGSAHNVKTFKELDGSVGINASTSGIDETQGLSSLSMYNYLNTVFSKSGVKVYSSKDASSNLVRESHYSVNLVGNGIMAFLYWANCVILLACFTVLGFFYAFAIMFRNIKRSFKVITALPFALMGALHSIAKVITYTLMLVIEIIVSMFVYTLCSELLMGISGLIEAPIVKLLYRTNNQFGVAGNGAFTSYGVADDLGIMPVMFILLLSCVIYVIFLVMSMKMRKQIVRTCDEAANSIVEKFILGKPTGEMPGGSGKGPGLISTAAGAVGAGAGMAMGSSLMSGALKKPDASPNVSSKGGGGNGGPSGGGSGGSVSGSVDSSVTGAAGAAAAGVISGGDTGGLPGPTGADGNGGLPGPVGGSGYGGAGGSGISGSNGILGLPGSDNTPEGVPIGGSGNSDTGSGMREDPSVGQQDDSDKSIGESLDNVNSLGDVPPGEEVEAEKMSEMTGQTSATEDEAADEAKAELAKEKRKEGVKEVATGGVDVAVGGAKAYVGAHTGNAQMVAEGAMQAGKGAGKMAEGGKKTATAGSEAKKQVAAERVHSGEAGNAGARAAEGVGGSGKSGTDGKRGTSGTNGSSGKNGANGGAKSVKSVKPASVQGKPGANGGAGKNGSMHGGSQGKPGTNGVPGGGSSSNTHSSTNSSVKAVQASSERVRTHSNNNGANNMRTVNNNSGHMTNVNNNSSRSVGGNVNNISNTSQKSASQQNLAQENFSRQNISADSNLRSEMNVNATRRPESNSSRSHQTRMQQSPNQSVNRSSGGYMQSRRPSEYSGNQGSRHVEQSPSQFQKPVIHKQTGVVNVNNVQGNNKISAPVKSAAATANMDNKAMTAGMLVAQQAQARRQQAQAREEKELKQRSDDVDDMF